MLVFGCLLVVCSRLRWFVVVTCFSNYAAGGQYIPIVNGIMNSENAPKDIVKPFIDLVNVAKGQIDKNQQTSAQQELERLFPSTRGGERGLESAS